MGEEYGEDSPFGYFVSHSDEKLIEAVRNGRREEFKSFEWQGEIPDPQAVATFIQSKLKWDKLKSDKHAVLLNFYSTVIRLRRSLSDFADKTGMHVRTMKKKKLLLWHRKFAKSQLQCVMNFAAEQQLLKLYVPQARWKKILDSAETKWLGPGSTLPEEIQGMETVAVPPRSIVLYESIEARPIKQEQQSKQQVRTVSGGSSVRPYCHV